MLLLEALSVSMHHMLTPTSNLRSTVDLECGEDTFSLVRDYSLRLMVRFPMAHSSSRSIPIPAMPRTILMCKAWLAWTRQLHYWQIVPIVSMIQSSTLMPCSWVGTTATYACHVITARRVMPVERAPMSSGRDLLVTMNLRRLRLCRCE